MVDKDLRTSIREGYDAWAAYEKKLGEEAGPEPIVVYEAAHKLVILIDALFDETGDPLSFFTVVSDDAMALHRIGADAYRYYRAVRHGETALPKKDTLSEG